MAKQKENKQPSNADWPLKDIRVPGDHDVVFGRGGASIHHPGCKAFREMVRAHQRQYIGYDDSRHMKTLLTHELVKKWREQTPPGRFLKKDEATGLWHDVGVASARRKTAQLLREGAKQIRKEMRESSSSSEDEEQEEYAAPSPTKKQKKNEPKKESFLDFVASSGTITPPTSTRQTATPVTPNSLAPVPALAAAVPAFPSREAPLRSESSVHRANLSADLRAMVRSAPKSVFQYGKPQNSLEMLQIVFEDILDDTKPIAATSSC